MKANAIELFEAIGDPYYRRHHRLRPGKSEAPETHRDANSEENRELFQTWIKFDALWDAVDRIVELETELCNQSWETDSR